MALPLGSTAWGDEALGGRDILPPPQEEGPDEQGIKTITSFRRNDKGQVEKVVKRTKIFTQVRQVPLSVEERAAKWVRFGAAAKQEEGITYTSYEEVKIEKPEQQQKSQLEVLQETTTSLVVCRRCGGAHWTLSCPYKDVQGAIGGRPDAAGAGSGAARPGAAGAGASAGGKYVPPSQRGAAAGADSNKEVPLEELTQVRVSNLSDDADEDDLRQLFRPFGHVDKIFVARDKVTQQPRGFAFVRYLRHDEADVALKALNGYPFMHLILRVEWSRPDNKGAGGGPGGMNVSQAHYSGYGKKLAQDVVKS